MNKADDDWSDSDDDLGSDVETSVLLGVPDGAIEAQEDILDAAVSRIGGRPAFLPSREPPITSSQCKSCSFPMELLIQVWCPFENSPMDRALYVWGCSRGSCQKTEGSVRAWRGLRYNRDYAAKLKKKALKQHEQRSASLLADKKRQEEELRRKVNPFSTNSTMSTNKPGPFGSGFGDVIIGGAAMSKQEPEPPLEHVSEQSFTDDAVQDEDDDADSAGLITAMTSVSLDESAWLASPAYPPLYLSTASEYLPPVPKGKLPAGIKVEDPLSDEEKGKGPSWALEGYENSLETDHVFDRFVKRVGYEGDQCLRYDLGGTPLPFSSDHIFHKLFPASATETLPVTKAAFKVTTALPKRRFTTSVVPKCPHCGSSRTFECQLMPNLINVLKTLDPKDEKTEKGEEQRLKEIQAALKGGASGMERRGMEWGTCMIFSCEKDCCAEDVNVQDEMTECWKEEVVWIQWDD